MGAGGQKWLKRLGLAVLVDEELAARFYGLYLFLLLLSFLLTHLALRRCRATCLSEAGVTLFVGFAGGGLLQLLVLEDGGDTFGEVEVRSALVSFSGSVMFCVLLPPIVFDSGYRMRGNFFWANIDKIVALAFVGTFISSVVVGALVFAGQGLISSERMSPAEALTFGALLSAVDPVATLSVLEELNVDPHLYSIIFGESVLNDAVSIVLFHTFAGCMDYTGPSAGVVLLAVANFVFILVGSTMVGVLCGCFSALLFKHMKLHLHSHDGVHLELAVFLVFCYAPYLLAECLTLSGTVAILFTGATMKRYTSSNLSLPAQEFLETMISLVSHVAESFIFIDLGTSAWQTFRASPALAAWALLACFIARAAHVYPLGIFLNSLPMAYPRRRLEVAQMHMVLCSGLRGAIAYALSTQFPGPHRQRVMSVTMAIVLATVWLLGGATVPLVRCLGIRRMHPNQLKQLSLTLEPFVNKLRVVHWERKYLRPMLVRHAPVSDDGSPLEAPALSDADAELELAGAVAAEHARGRLSSASAAAASARTLAAWTAMLRGGGVGARLRGPLDAEEEVAPFGGCSFAEAVPRPGVAPPSHPANGARAEGGWPLVEQRADADSGQE